jgi:hypothetical protein
MLTPEEEEGSYDIDDEKVRADITEGRPGVPLKPRVALVDSTGCAPLENAAARYLALRSFGRDSGFTTGNRDGWAVCHLEPTKPMRCGF